MLLVTSNVMGALTLLNAQAVDPPLVETILDPGESLVVTKTVTNPLIPPKLDLLLLEDETGSFQDDIANMQGPGGLADQLWDALVAAVPDFQGGVAGFRDFEQDGWGSPGDWVYRLLQDLTSIKADWTAGINLLSANGGADYPEAQLAALKSGADGHAWDSNGDGDFADPNDTPAGENPTWRTDATKVIVLVTDATYHEQGDTPVPPGYPGPTYAETIAELNAAGVHVIALVTSGLEDDYADLTDDTRGTVKLISDDSSDIVQAIEEALEEIVTDVWGEVECEGGIEVTLDPEVKYDVESGCACEFVETIYVPDDTPPGTYHCTVTFIANNYPDEGAVVGVQDIYVTVPEIEIFPRDAKLRALELVSGIETDDYRLNFKNKLIISYITKSLNPALWLDPDHVDPMMGWLVFKYEFMACNHMKILMADYPDNKVLVETYMEACELLVEADMILAQTLLNEADALAPPEGTPARAIYDTYFAKAKLYFEKGVEYMDAGDCCRAILQFEYSWLQSKTIIQKFS